MSSCAPCRRRSTRCLKKSNAPHTRSPSPPGYGTPIDLNLAFSDYWYWRPHDGPIVYRSRMAEEIVTIFETHGFIWGGKWYHFDTMHFEYRPELLVTR